MSRLHVLRTAAAAGVLLTALAGCGGGDKAKDTPAGSGTPAAGATTDKVDVKDFVYKPEDITVKVGTKVTWTFSDDAAHNVDPVGASELVKSPDLKNGAVYSFTFTKPGMVKYRCGIHNYMTGSVMVTA